MNYIENLFYVSIFSHSLSNLFHPFINFVSLYMERIIKKLELKDIEKKKMYGMDNEMIYLFVNT